MAGAVVLVQHQVHIRHHPALAALGQGLQQQARQLLPRRHPELKLDQIVAGDLLVARPGDQIVVDGQVCGDGRMAVDESLLTGESDHVAKAAGAGGTAAAVNARIDGHAPACTRPGFDDPGRLTGRPVQDRLAATIATNERLAARPTRAPPIK